MCKRMVLVLELEVMVENHFLKWEFQCLHIYHLLNISTIIFSFPLMYSILQLNRLIESLQLLDIFNSEMCFKNVRSYA